MSLNFEAVQKGVCFLGNLEAYQCRIGDMKSFFDAEHVLG